MKIITELNLIKAQLKHGDQRHIATSLREHPARVSDALNGFISNESFLKSVKSAALKIIKDRQMELS